MKKNKKIIIVCLIIILLISLSIEIYAYFTYKTSAENTIVLGYNKIQLNENYNPPLTIEPGIEFTKEPYVKNTGNVNCYVRVKSEVSDSRIKDYLEIDYNTDNYELKDDGYYYYKHILEPGQSSEKLFTKVKILEDADEDILEGFDIYIYAESVQVVNGKNMEETWEYFNNPN